MGRGHTTLSGGATSVRAAGELKIVNGQVKAITYSSGHYKPSIIQGNAAINQLKQMGIDLSGTKITLYTAEGKIFSYSTHQ